MAQSTKKAPDPNKINFEIFYMIWKYEKKQMTKIVKYIVQLGYHFKK